LLIFDGFYVLGVFDFLCFGEYVLGNCLFDFRGRFRASFPPSGLEVGSIHGMNAPLITNEQPSAL
jgi:hypothetical protein